MKGVRDYLHGVVLIAVSSLVRHNVLPRIWYPNEILARVFLWTVGNIFRQVGNGRVTPPPQRGSDLCLTAPYFIPCRPECVILLPRVGRVKKLRAFAYTYFLVSGLIVLIAVSSLVRHNVLPCIWYPNKILARVFLWTVGDIFGQVGDGRVAPPPQTWLGSRLDSPLFYTMQARVRNTATQGRTSQEITRICIHVFSCQGLDLLCVAPYPMGKANSA